MARVQGGLRVFGGLGEGTASAGLALVPEPTALTKVAAVGIGIRAADNIQTGFRQLYTGVPTNTLTSEVVAGGLILAGVDDGSALRFGGVVDVGADVASALLTLRAPAPKAFGFDKTLPPGNGATNRFGDVVISPHGSAVDIAQARVHESVHSFLSPNRNSLFGNFRADTRLGLYKNTNTFQFAEEFLAETAAQLATRSSTGNSFAGAIRQGFRFPLNTADYTVNGNVITLPAIGREIARPSVIYGGTAFGAYEGSSFIFGD